MHLSGHLLNRRTAGAASDYEVRLSVNDRTYSKPLHVDMDPRIKVSPTDLTEQLAWSAKLVNELA